VLNFTKFQLFILILAIFSFFGEFPTFSVKSAKSAPWAPAGQKDACSQWIIDGFGGVAHEKVKIIIFLHFSKKIL